MICFFAALALVMITVGVSLAENSILSSLQNQGVSHSVMNDAALDEARGTSLYTGMPLPSYTVGERKHHVTWKHFGSQYDYAQYNYVGSASTYGKVVEGDGYGGFGDIWMADTISTGTTWVAANAQEFERHVQLLWSDGTLSQYTSHYTNWNRPISTFSW